MPMLHATRVHRNSTADANSLMKHARKQYLKTVLAFSLATMWVASLMYLVYVFVKAACQLE